MLDSDQRLKNIEERLNIMNDSARLEVWGNKSSEKNEVDILELWRILWNGRLWVLTITTVFSIIGLIYALALPNLYTSEGVYSSAQSSDGGALTGQLGGLAALAGVNILAGESNDIDQAIALVKSWPFTDELINKNKLAPFFDAVKGWNYESKEIVWDKEKFDPVKSLWHSDESGEPLKPSSYQLYLKFRESVDVNLDSKSGLVKISVTHISPVFAEHVVKLIIESVNIHFQERDIAEAKKNISYLEEKVASTSIAEMKSVFYGMIETQMKKLMIAEVSDHYLLKEVVPPKVAELKSKPSRTIICIFFFLSGLTTSSFCVVVVNLLRKNMK